MYTILIITLIILSFIFKKQHKIFKWISLVVSTLPCFLFKMTTTLTQEHHKTPKMAYIILLITVSLLLCYILIPCLIKKIFLLKPSGTDTYLKLSFQHKIKDVQAAIKQLKKQINKRKLLTPEVNWDKPWIDSSKKKIQYELNQLGYPEESETKKSKIFQYILFLAHIYTLPFYAKVPSKLKPSNYQTTELIVRERKLMHKDVIELNKFTLQLSNLTSQQKTYKSKFQTIQLLNEPIYTDKRTENPEWDFVNLQSRGIYNYNFALSFWVFIHGQSLNHGLFYKNFSSILNFGNKPQILYNMEQQKLQIRMNKKNIIFETNELPMQKWHNFVFNFTGGHLDVFINNKIVASKENIIPHLSDDRIIIGQKNGLSGGICNIVYFPSYLSKLKIAMYYNILKIRNPPILPNCNI